MMFGSSICDASSMMASVKALMSNTNGRDMMVDVVPTITRVAAICALTSPRRGQRRTVSPSRRCLNAGSALYSLPIRM